MGKKYNGVLYHARKNKFEAVVKHKDKSRRKTFPTAKEAAEAFDSFSHYVEKQKKPRNFAGTPKKIEWPEMPHRAAGGAAAVAAQVAHRRIVGKKAKKQIKKRK